MDIPVCMDDNDVLAWPTGARGLYSVQIHYYYAYDYAQKASRYQQASGGD
jgi:hypothetical protein